MKDESRPTLACSLQRANNAGIWMGTLDEQNQQDNGGVRKGPSLNDMSMSTIIFLGSHYSSDHVFEKVKPFGFPPFISQTKPIDK